MAFWNVPDFTDIVAGVFVPTISNVAQAAVATGTIVGGGGATILLGGAEALSGAEVFGGPDNKLTEALDEMGTITKGFAMGGVSGLTEAVDDQFDVGPQGDGDVKSGFDYAKAVYYDDDAAVQEHLEAMSGESGNFWHEQLLTGPSDPIGDGLKVGLAFWEAEYGKLEEAGVESGEPPNMAAMYNELEGWAEPIFLSVLGLNLGKAVILGMMRSGLIPAAVTWAIVSSMRTGFAIPALLTTLLGILGGDGDSDDEEEEEEETVEDEEVEDETETELPPEVLDDEDLEGTDTDEENDIVVVDLDHDPSVTQRRPAYESIEKHY